MDPNFLSSVGFGVCPSFSSLRLSEKEQALMNKISDSCAMKALQSGVSGGMMGMVMGMITGSLEGAQFAVSGQEIPREELIGRRCDRTDNALNASQAKRIRRDQATSHEYITSGGVGSTSAFANGARQFFSSLYDGSKYSVFKGLEYAASFGIMSAVQTGTECCVERARGVQDRWNGPVAGCISGAILNVRGGPRAMAIGCANFAAFSAAMDVLSSYR